MTPILKNIFLGILLLSAVNLLAQPFNNAINSPSIPSAAAMNYGKQAEINTNFYTGAAGYSLPLCTVSDATVSHNIGISYNSSFRVGEIASNVGLGFHLNAGGLITRTILNLEDDDEDKGFYHKGGDIPTSNPAVAAEGGIDSESDIYVISAGELNLKFIFNGSGDVFTMPKSDVLITPVLENDMTFKGFKVQMPDNGMIYYFGYHPLTNVKALEYTDVNDTRQLTSWMLMRIESFDHNHHIDFEYAENIYRFFSLPYCLKTGYRDNSGNTNFTPDCADNPTDTKVDGHLIKKITSFTKTVTFNHFEREDLWVNDLDRPMGINQVKIESGDFCYQYDLIQDYFEDQNTAIVTPNYKRLQLKEVRKKACLTTESEPAFIFDYYGYENTDGSDFFCSILDKNRDHWDFYNYRYDQTNPTDNNDEDDIIPTSNGVTAHGNVALSSPVERSSYHNAQLIGALKRVTLPTKGYTELQYESNEFFKYGGTPIPVFSLLSCSCHCGGMHTDDRTIQISEQLLETGRWELCIEPFIDNTDCTGYSTTSNEARLNVYDNLGRLHYTMGFDSDVQKCMSGDVSDMINRMTGGLQEGQSYRFEVKSTNASATLSMSYLTGGNNSIAGGLRLKQTAIYNGDKNLDGSENHNKDIIKTYEYKDADDNTRSSGVLFNQPKYAFVVNDYSVLFTSSSVLPLSGFSGYHIGYKNVVIEHNGNGRERYEFFFEDSTQIYDTYPIVPDPIRIEAGVLKIQETINQNGTVEVSNNTERYDQDSYTYAGTYTYKAQKVPASLSGGTPVETVYFNYYTPRTSVFRPGTVTATKDGVSTTTNYQYHPTIIVPNIITSTNSDGKITEQNISYTIDHPSLLIKNNLAFENRITIPFESTTYVNGNWLDGTKTTFAYFDVDGKNPDEVFQSGGIIRPYKTWRFERTWSNGQLGSGVWNIQEYFDTYTHDGMLETWHKPYWDEETYTYNKRLLTSKSYLGFTKNYLYYLNSSLPQTITDADGTTQNIAYDGLTRTKVVTDVCKGITTTYDYHFTTGGSDKNYVKTTTDYPSPDANSQLNILENYTYKDGLGRIIATIRKHQAPNSANDDIITSIEYDKYGRIDKNYEPQLLNSNNGAYEEPQGNWKFTQNTFYPSPLNRIHTVTPPDWFAITYEYSANEVADDITIDSTNMVYGDNQLFKQTIIDGNTHKSINFTDKKGRNILSRRTNNGEVASINYDTKNIFDDKDRKVYTLPPKTNINQKDLLFFCEYDREDRKVREYIPGKAEIRYYFNRQDLLVAKRDGYILQHPNHRYYVYHYDNYGRELSSGFYDSNLLYPDYGHEPTEKLIETVYGTSPHELDKVKTVKTKILDGGTNWLETTTTYSACGLVTNQSSNNHKNLTQESETTTLNYDGGDNLTRTTYNHSAFGNSLPIKSQETYDYGGRAKNSFFQVGSGTNYPINSKFYDEEEQLIQKLQGGTGLSGNLAWLQKCDYSYLENGILNKINSDALTGSQRILLDCPISLPTPANPSTSSLDNKDLFYLELAYHVPFSGTSAISQKNGNVTGIKWQVRGREKQGFSLQYDLYNRLTNADYFDENSSQVIDESGTYDVALTYDERGNIKTLSRYGLTPTENCYEEILIDQLDYSYADSNHLALVKDAAPCPENKYIQPTIDNSELHAADTMIIADNEINSSILVTYQAGKEVRLTAGFHVPTGMEFLAKIEDCPQNGFETDGYTQRNLDTSRYDINGNLKLDPQKVITNIFNHLDLPEQITLEDGKTVNFTYDATGTLLTKVLKDKDGLVLETRDYINGLEYIDGTLESIYHNEGRLHYINGTPRMEYAVVDHLDNTRLIYSDLNGDGIISTPSEILDETHYYPNGLKMEGYWMNSARFRYTFNGIEDIDDFGLNVNRATYRMLDPALAKWWGVDPAAESFVALTPYNSMGNSPIMNKDPNGDFFMMAVMAGAILNAGFQGLSGNINSFGDFAGAVGIGGASAAGGFGVGQAVSGSLGSLGFTSGFLSGAAGGGTGGFLGGAGNAWANGAGFGSGLLSGAQAGTVAAFSSGITSGINAGTNAVKHGGNFWSGEGAAFHGVATTSGIAGDPVEYSNESAKAFSDKYFGEVESVDNLYADNSLGINDELTSDGMYAVNVNGQKVYGTTVYKGTGKGSDVYLYKGAFVSKEELYLSMGHEYIHANLNAAGYIGRTNIIRKQHHAWIYDWQTTQAWKWGINQSYYVGGNSSYYANFKSVNKWGKYMFPIKDKKPW